MSNSISVATYLGFEDLFQSLFINGLYLGVSVVLSDPALLRQAILKKIEDMDPVDLIRFNSFLNMVAQTRSPREIMSIGNKELVLAKLANVVLPNKIFLVRDSILNITTRIISENVSGKKAVTGQINPANASDYYASLLLVNSELSEIQAKSGSLFKDIFIREYPHSYNPEWVEHIYSQRLRRYEFIYLELLSVLPVSSIDRFKIKLQEFETRVGVPLSEYFSVLFGLFNWYLRVPNQKRNNAKASSSLKGYGFDPKYSSTYYIERQQFSDRKDILRVIDSLSKDLEQFRGEFLKQKQSGKLIANSYYEYLPVIFNNPVFKVNDDNYTILDLKFLLESICGGLFWRLEEAPLKDQDGELVEHYFKWLLKSIFPEPMLAFEGESDKGWPDGILETDEAIFIFEFTTEYYRFASLYSVDCDDLYKDIHRLLFNKGSSDPLARNKKEQGKFFKLQNYVLSQANPGKKRIIPILVTENYVGDYDLLNEFDALVSKEINDAELHALKEFKPVIICLDDLETFWALHSKEDAPEAFKGLLARWESVRKGPHYFNLGQFMIRNAPRMTNLGYKEFFINHYLVNHAPKTRGV